MSKLWQLSLEAVEARKAAGDGWGVEFGLLETEPSAGEATGGLFPLCIVRHGSNIVAEGVTEFVVKAGKGVGLEVGGVERMLRITVHTPAQERRSRRATWGSSNSSSSMNQASS